MESQELEERTIPYVCPHCERHALSYSLTSIIIIMIVYISLIVCIIVYVDPTLAEEQYKISIDEKLDPNLNDSDLPVENSSLYFNG